LRKQRQLNSSLCIFKVSNFILETESREYDACHFNLNERHIKSRSAKITPKKVGQFVTFWKRNENRLIEPFTEFEEIDFYIMNLRTKSKFGQFVFPKSILIKKGMISTKKKEGKRAFRVYPRWDIATNKQAERTQKWQLDYFYEINDLIDFKKILELYQAK